MSDMLKVSQPLVRPEQANAARPSAQPNNTNITGIVDPSKVVRPDGKNIQDNSSSGQQGAHLTSNFESFMQSLKNVPGLSDSFTELIFSKLGNLVSSGIDTGFAKEISEFMQLLKMSEADLMPFLESQLQTSLKFQGPIFDVLRKLLNQTKSEGLKQSILEFLKTFDNAQSANHTMKNIMSNLEQIAKRMTSAQRQELKQLMSELSTAPMQGANSKNLNLLKGSIIPLLSKYITQTKDFGPIRDIITRLTLNIVSYENGTTENLLNSLQALLKNPTVSKQMANISAKEIESALAGESFKNADTELIDSFVSVLSRGMKGDANDPSGKEFFADLLKSVLLNKSVYMPLQHVIIPADINGTMFFSEMWVDPDAQDSGKNASGEPAAKLLVKFDIQNVGFFEMVIICKESKVDMLFFTPGAFSTRSIEIKKAITQIMEKNGLKCGSVSVEKSIKPLAVSDVFPKIYERKDTIDVKV